VVDELVSCIGVVINIVGKEVSHAQTYIILHHLQEGFKAKNKIYYLKLDLLLMIFCNGSWEGKVSPTSDICGLPALPKGKELAIQISCCVNILWVRG